MHFATAVNRFGRTTILRECQGGLIEKENSEPKNLWGINIHPDFKGEKFIEFDSMINLKPGLGNRTRGIDNIEIRNKIIKIVTKLVKYDL